MPAAHINNKTHMTLTAVAYTKKNHSQNILMINGN